MLAVTSLAVVFFYATSGVFQNRIDRVIHEYASWHPGTPAKEVDSTGIRLEFYRNTLDIVREHPIFGSGPGSFPSKYAEKVKGTGMVSTQNPHNEYLLVAAQVGLVGIALMLNLFWQQWRLARRLASPFETHLARGVVLTVACGCLFNSMLLDHTEGLLFAWLTAVLYAGLQSKRMDDRSCAM